MENAGKHVDTPKCPKCKGPMVRIESYKKPLPKDALRKIRQLKKLSDYASNQIWICDKCLVMGLWLDADSQE